MLTVYNVGQGDSMLLTTMCVNSCCFDKEPMLIDCGHAKAAVHTRLPKKSIRVMVTHADSDHIGGLADVLSNHHVTRLYVPRYLPEIQRIEKYLQNKIKRKVNPLPASILNVPRIEVAENDHLCTHATVLNPPKNGLDALRRLDPDLGVVDVSTATRSLEFLRELGIDLPTDEIIHYRPDPPQVADGITRYPPSLTARKRAFVRGFFIYLAAQLRNFGNDAEVIDNAIKMTANQVSIVMRFEGFKTWLFTGDADPSVFQRIAIKNLTSLKVDYLKVPHHGSSHNLDNASLNLISPIIAFISHGNAKFGKATDPHPNQATMNLLSGSNITTYYTNDVVKNGMCIANKTTGMTSCLQLTFS
jgi:beta-lactamase superfamily II metal-dependent hydrolase